MLMVFFAVNFYYYIFDLLMFTIISMGLLKSLMFAIHPFFKLLLLGIIKLLINN